MNRKTIQKLKRNIEKYAEYKAIWNVHLQGNQEPWMHADYEKMEKARRIVNEILNEEWQKQNDL